MCCSKHYYYHYLNEGHTRNEWKIFTHYKLHLKVYPENWNIWNKKNTHTHTIHCHLHISGMCFPVKVSAFACVCACVENTLQNEEKTINFLWRCTNTHGKSERNKVSKGTRQKLRTDFRTGISLSFAPCTRFSVAFLFCQSHRCLPQSVWSEINVHCVLQMMTRKGSKHTKIHHTHERERGKDCLAIKIGMLEMPWVFFSFVSIEQKKAPKGT